MISLISLISLCLSARAAAPLQHFPLSHSTRFRRRRDRSSNRPRARPPRSPTDAAAVGAFGRALHAWEQWSSAHEVYARAAALAPRAFEWRYLDAVVLQRLARHADAATRLREALSLSPDYLPARVKLAEALLESGDLEESKTLFLALVDEPAARPAAEVGLGRIAAAAAASTTRPSRISSAP